MGSVIGLVDGVPSMKWDSGELFCSTNIFIEALMYSRFKTFFISQIHLKLVQKIFKKSAQPMHRDGGDKFW